MGWGQNFQGGKWVCCVVYRPTMVVQRKENNFIARKSVQAPSPLEEGKEEGRKEGGVLRCRKKEGELTRAFSLCPTGLARSTWLLKMFVKISAHTRRTVGLLDFETAAVSVSDYASVGTLWLLLLLVLPLDPTIHTMAHTPAGSWGFRGRGGQRPP